jgi:hypothetical protein
MLLAVHMSLATGTHLAGSQLHATVHAQPCMQGSGNAACLLCMLGAVYFHMPHKQRRYTADLEFLLLLKLICFM